MVDTLSLILFYMRSFMPVVIAAASARHGDCAKACVEGLAQRRAATGRDVHYIHVRSLFYIISQSNF